MCRRQRDSAVHVQIKNKMVDPISLFRVDVVEVIAHVLESYVRCELYLYICWNYEKHTISHIFQSLGSP